MGDEPISAATAGSNVDIAEAEVFAVSAFPRAGSLGRDSIQSSPLVVTHPQACRGDVPLGVPKDATPTESGERPHFDVPPVPRCGVSIVLRHRGRDPVRTRRSLKYIRLAAYLADQPAGVERIEMSVDEIEHVIGEDLPPNARFPSWWRNDARRMHARAWLTAGWIVEEMVKTKKRVVFSRDRNVT